ncbi:hypothetical protein ACHAWO_012225 [Cyclotella atomus]|uniref:Rhodanese domain-containing protein n=1 Tax=Cyclotella atomus TaxID=382360 RepID=A0ABD3MTE7_9STRA
MTDQSQSPPSEYRILALYRFLPLVTDSEASTVDQNSSDAPSHPERHPILKKLSTDLYDALRPLQVRGTLLLAPEGINGTICYPCISTCDSAHDGAAGEINGDNDPVYQYLKTHPLFGGEELRTRLSVWKDYFNEEDCRSDIELDEAQQKIQELKQPQQAFQRLKIKVKAEIVTMGLGRPLFRDGRVADDHQNYQNKHNNQQTSDSGAADNKPATRQQHNQKCNPLLTKGQYLSPKSWDEAVKDPEVLVIDTRNTYEIDIGTFDGAVDPKTKHFSEFPQYLEKLAGEFDWSAYHNKSGASSICDTEKQEELTNDADAAKGIEKKKPPKAIAMFCTGGIRCEKATSYALQSNLFPEGMPIYHLEGGILAYLDYAAKEKSAQNTDAAECDKESRDHKSTFHGECFVFDKRVAVTEGLQPSKNYIPCYGCRGPMDRRLLLDNNCGDKRKSAEVPPSKYIVLMEGVPNLPELKYDSETKAWYLPGLTCPRCHDGTTRESLERFAQRKEQMEICKREGKEHFRDGKADTTCT